MVFKVEPMLTPRPKNFNSAVVNGSRQNHLKKLVLAVFDPAHDLSQ